MPSWGSGQMSTSSAESTSLPAMKVSKEVSSLLALPAVKVQRSERDSGTRLRNSRIGKHSRRQPLGEISTLMRSSSALTSRRHQEAETGSRMAARRFSTSSASVTESNASSSSVACASSAAQTSSARTLKGFSIVGWERPRMQTSTKKSITLSSGLMPAQALKHLRAARLRPSLRLRKARQKSVSQRPSVRSSRPSSSASALFRSSFPDSLRLAIARASSKA